MRTAWIAVLGETRKGLLISWTYRVNSITSFLTLGFIFVVISFFMGGGDLDPQSLTTALLGYLTWMYVALAVSDLSGGIRGEMNVGTLEQMAMSPVPIGLILSSRICRVSGVIAIHFTCLIVPRLSVWAKATRR